jgi:EAL domain-containing protein (putative c-di-GMP-specific phosphodiesterase class I)
MNLSATESVSTQNPTAAHSKTDHILLELWQIKRELNEEAHYDIAELARRANAFDIDLAMKQLGVSLKSSTKVARLPPDTNAPAGASGV